MDDLISRQKAIDLFLAEGMVTAAVYVERMPSAQPERKKGKWMWDGESRREYPYKCSECGEIDYYAFLYDTETREFKQQDNFCPNCGADMRGEAND